MSNTEESVKAYCSGCGREFQCLPHRVNKPCHMGVEFVLPKLFSPECEHFPHAGYVYVFFSDYRGLYKIGCSKHPMARLEQVRRDYPNELIIPLFAVPSADKLIAERGLHHHFRAKRIEREWFDLDEDDLQLIYSVKLFKRGRAGSIVGG